MKKFAGWMAAPVAALWSVAVRAQEQAQAAEAVVEGVSPIWAGVFVAMVLGLIAWFVVALVRAENKRKAEQASG